MAKVSATISLDMNTVIWIDAQCSILRCKRGEVIDKLVTAHVNADKKKMENANGKEK